MIKFLFISFLRLFLFPLHFAAQTSCKIIITKKKFSLVFSLLPKVCVWVKCGKRGRANGIPLFKSISKQYFTLRLVMPVETIAVFVMSLWMEGLLLPRDSAAVHSQRWLVSLALLRLVIALLTNSWHGLVLAPEGQQTGKIHIKNIDKATTR